MQTGEGVEVSVRHAGQASKVTASYLVGCDGAHSTVRHALEIPFQGGAYEGTFLLGDVKLSWPWPYDTIRTFVNDRGTLACFPLREPQRYRLIIAPKDAAPTGELSLEELERAAREIGSPEISLQESYWLSRFRTHHRVASRYQDRRVFLAGDAAHIHSPVGGQGMNTGMTDALNLGAILAPS